MSEYQSKVMSLNISSSVTQFMQLKAGGEMETPIQCILTKDRITIPVRHRGIINIKCIFEFTIWIEYCESIDFEEQNLFKVRFSQCPGCKANVRLSDYGVDYLLFNAIAMLQYTDQINRFKRDKLGAMYSQNKFYGILKQDPSIKILLPGCSAILSLQRKQQQNLNINLNTNTLRISEEISRTTDKMEQYLKMKKYQAIVIRDIDFGLINEKLSKRVPAVKQAVIQNCQLVQIGKQSITVNDFVFALNKSQSEGQPSSILVIYYPRQNIWMDFELFFENGQRYLQQEQALYIKDSTQDKFNIIYIIGGKTSQFEQNAQFLKIQIPKDPYTQLKELVIIRMPDLLQIGYNFLGTVYKNKIFIFYGQKKYINSQNFITDELLNVAQVFKNHQWQNLNLDPIPRFDGSYFTFDHQILGKCIIFFGGVANQPDGLPNHCCTQQREGQIFVCRDESFYNNSVFQLQFPVKLNKTEKVVCSPVFSIPYFKSKQLLISGNFLKENLNGKRQIFTFDWEEGTMILNEFFSLEPPEQILYPFYQQVATGQKIFTPVQDCEGCVIYGNFYTIHQFEESGHSGQKVSIVQLLCINQTNGLFTISPYQDRVESQEKFYQRYQNLGNANIVTKIYP